MVYYVICVSAPHQESNFYYLSGCAVPRSFLLLTASSTNALESSSLSLFIPDVEPADLMWSVPPPTPDAAREAHDVGYVGLTTELATAIVDALSASPDALVHTLPIASSLFPELPDKYLKLARGGAAVSDEYLLPALHRARLVKDADEVERIRTANQISSRAHEVVMRVLGKGVREQEKAAGAGGAPRPLLPEDWLIEKEAEAEAIFVASCRREGCVVTFAAAMLSDVPNDAQRCPPSLSTHRRRFYTCVDSALLLQRQGVCVGTCPATRSS